MTAAVMPLRRSRGRWPAAQLWLSGALLALLLLFAPDAADMARLWWTSSTYEHCLLIPPIAGWLVWLRRQELARLETFGWAPGLWLVAAGALGWLVGAAAAVAVARHLGLVLMVQGAVLACLGPAVARGLAFPLAYLLFAAPFGEALEAPLQQVTARLCVAMLALAGVPVRGDGVFITTPVGLFQVAEACSGVKFVLAMIAFGALVAAVGFRSWWRRAAVMAAACVLPVLANGVRAWGTIMVAERMGAGFAGRFDHVFYGWIFFGLVIALMLAAAWRFFDRPADAPWIDADRIARRTARARRRSPATMAVATICVAVVAPAWSAHIAARTPAALAPAGLPPLPGWRETAPSDAWVPHFSGADRLLRARYVDGRGRAVDLAVALFADQSRGRALVGYGQGAAPPGGRWTWVEDRPAPPPWRTMRLRGADGAARTVLTSYRLGGITTAHEETVKLETLRLHLLGGDPRGAALLVSADDDEGGQPAIDRFLRALGPPDRVPDRLLGR